MTSAVEDAAIGAEPGAEELLRLANSPHSSPFDYVIVGSGAGGGPLAARLALGGRRVLLLDAGGDPAHTRSVTHPAAQPGEVYACPGYHGAATEDYEMSWQFSVRHYADTGRQALDEKYDREDPPDPRFLDPARRGGVGHGGIFYPRNASLGGCTSHHAMIVAVPNDRDWDDVADLTGDESWRASHMRGYFARLERCLYRDAYGRWVRRLLGPIYDLWQYLVLLFDPRALLDEGGHGTQGWQPTSFIDPNLIEGIRDTDRGFVKLLIGATLAVLHSDNRLIGLLKRSLVALRVVQHIDPNDLNTRRTSPEGVFLIPTGIESGTESGDLFGRRVGVREFLLETRDKHPDRLVIATDVHVTRVLFEAPPSSAGQHEPPRAIGVEAAESSHLYEASPLRVRPPSERVRYFAKREVILCGGAFNTPQLLMLSGIGDASRLQQWQSCALRGVDGPLAAGDGSPVRIDLPGVGRNLQDRYEVSVISELDEELATLEGATFTPGDPNDPIRSEWLQKHEGLYRTNGGTLAVLHRSRALGPDEPEPDIFAFGVPAAFRGYYFGWSRELLRRTLGAPTDQRNLWSWVILKAYTRNEAGNVRLRSDSPFDQPEICFDSFNEQAEAESERLAERASRVPAGRPLPPALEAAIAANRELLADSRRDLTALLDAVSFLRRVNARNPQKFVREIQPGPERADDSRELAEWIRTQAWGHHASCTCRVGSDHWQADPAELRDRGAVLDSSFRVHGVRGLRVVDASVFPKIPGYFILAPTLMVSEKAADVLLAEPGDSVYPREFRERESAAVAARRARAGVASDVGERTAARAGLPRNAVGLALSGGGIRSATFALGVLQALAGRDRLRSVDFLSTVSGGGFIGSFLGRLFTRETVRRAADPVGRVQDTLLDGRSGPLWWLRTRANYLFANGSADRRYGLATFLLKLFSVHLVVGSLLFATFGALAWLGPRVLPERLPGVSIDPSRWMDTMQLPIELSAWWWAPIVALGFGVLPVAVAYWLSQKSGSYRPYPYLALGAWVVLLAGAFWIMQTPSGLAPAGAALVVLLLAWVWQDVARWGAEPARELDEAQEHLARLRRHGSPTDAQREEVRRKEAIARQQMGGIVRNRLTRALGETIFIFGSLAAFVVLDTLAGLFAMRGFSTATAAVLMALAPALPILRYVGMGALRQISAGGGKLSLVRVARTLSIPLAVLLLFAIDVFAQRLWIDHPLEARWVFALVAAFSLVIGRAFGFLNLSSLRAAYGARLARTFLGASNPARVYSASSDDGQDVQAVHPDDDLPHHRYHPEHSGGPLHLINVCINETIDTASERETRERKGIPMCVTPHGVSVGRRYFAEWTPPSKLPRWLRWRRWRAGLDHESLAPEERPPTALRPIATTSDPNAFHVLRADGRPSAPVEPLSLGTWTAISGAAFTTGTGRGTTIPLALFMGLLNVRLGYWWDSGVRASERPGRYPLPLWRRIKRWPPALFAVQSMLLSEWWARFRGPAQRFWYLSDGGHFEVTGLYEMLRRRVPFMIVSDAGEDPDYRFGDVAQLMQQARVDFGARVEWLPSLPDDMPFRDWIDPNEVGPIDRLDRASRHSAAVARVTWERGDDEAWILLIKPNLGGELSRDVRTYASNHASFPQESTFDQAFDDIQWESYRALGQQLGLRVLRGENR